MDRRQKIVMKLVLSLIVFFVFMVILSPVYIHRSVILKITYTASAKISVNIHSFHHVTDPCPKSIFKAEKYDLAISKGPETVYLEIPTDNRCGGLLFSFSETACTLKIHKAAVLVRGKEYLLPLDKYITVRKNQQNFKFADNILSIKPGGKKNIRFLFEDVLRIYRHIELIELLYVALLSLLPALLVFRETDFLLNKKNAVSLLYSTTVVFLLIFPVLLIDYQGKIGTENRFKNKFPSFFIHQRFNLFFPKQLEDWFADRFTGRDYAIQYEKKIFSQDFDSFSGGKVIVGHDRWLFGKGWDAVAMYQNKNRFSESQLKICAENVTLLNDYCRKKNIKLYIMLLPDKERVYSEYYPESYKQLHPESRLEQLAGYLTENTSVKIICPLKEIRNAKKQSLTYFKTGTHWSYRGAHAGALALLQEIKKDFPLLPMEQPNAKIWKKTLCADIDLAMQAGYTDPEKQLPQNELLYDEPKITFPFHFQQIDEESFGDCFLREYSAKTPLPNSLRIFVCSDSFWRYMLNFMFPAADKLRQASFENGAKFALEFIRGPLEEFHPDILVIESAERFLDRFLTINIDGE